MSPSPTVSTPASPAVAKACNTCSPFPHTHSLMLLSITLVLQQRHPQHFDLAAVKLQSISICTRTGRQNLTAASVPDTFRHATKQTDKCVGCAGHRGGAWSVHRSVDAAALVPSARRSSTQRCLYIPCCGTAPHTVTWAVTTMQTLVTVTAWKCCLHLSPQESPQKSLTEVWVRSLRHLTCNIAVCSCMIDAASLSLHVSLHGCDDSAQ